MQILIVSDGSGDAREAALFATHIARPAKADVTLLGIAESQQHEERLRPTFEALREEIAQRGGGQVKLKIRQGFIEDQILAETREHFYHLVAVGSRGRRHLQRFLLGSRAKRLARHVPVSILIVTTERPNIKRMLICTGGARQGEVDTLVGGALAALLGSQVTVLHVMSQVPLIPEAPLEDLESEAPDLIESATREGQHLLRAMEILESQGVPPEYRFAKVRRGLVLDEILEEVHEGDYDLIVIGAHQVPEEKPWHELIQLLQEDVADRILSSTRRPVLVVRVLDEEEWKVPVGGSYRDMP